MIHGAVNQALVDLVTEVAQRHSATPAQVALAWILSRDGKMVPIPGTKHLSRLKENLGAADLVLSPDDLALLDRQSAAIALVGARLPATFGHDCPIVHVKKSSANKCGHWPFVEPCNSTGRILPGEMAETLRRTGPQDCEICLELPFREREHTDRQAIDMMRESVEYWKLHVDN